MRRVIRWSGWRQWWTSSYSGCPVVAVLGGGPRNKGGRPQFDPVLMFKILVLQALYSLSDKTTEFKSKTAARSGASCALGWKAPFDATTVCRSANGW